jgi:hypothetical protein
MTWRILVTIRTHLNSVVVFEPDTLQVMSQAFHEACNALHVFAGDERGRQIIATRVIDLASTGVTDVEALRDRVLMEARTAA